MDGRASKDFDTLAPIVRDLYAQGESLTRIAELIGKGTMTVSRWLDLLGVSKRDGGSGTRGKPWSPARRAATPARPQPERPVVDGCAVRGYDLLAHRTIGNKTIHTNGYVLVHVGRKQRRYEHVLVAEKAIGRKLRRGEVVHHINCVKTDNRPENLLVCTHAYHLALHARMRQSDYWQQVEALAREIH